jgi:hypothetical protein
MLWLCLTHTFASNTSSCKFPRHQDYVATIMLLYVVEGPGEYSTWMIPSSPLGHFSLRRCSSLSQTCKSFPNSPDHYANVSQTCPDHVTQRDRAANADKAASAGTLPCLGSPAEFKSYRHKGGQSTLTLRERSHAGIHTECNLSWEPRQGAYPCPAKCVSEIAQTMARCQ